MANNGTWGMDTEMCVLAHLLNTVVYNFNSSGYWLPCLPHGIEFIRRAWHRACAYTIAILSGNRKL